MERKESLKPNRSYNIISFNGECAAIGYTESDGIASEGVVGGGAVIAEMHTQWLRHLGHNAVVLSPQPKGYSIQEDESHIFLSREVPWESNIRNLQRHKELLNEVLSKIDNSDILYVSHPLVGSLIALLRKSEKISSNTKFVYVGQSWGKMIEEAISPRKMYLGREDVEKEILSTADIIIVYTEAEKNIISHLYDLPPEYVEEKIRIVPLGVDTLKFNPEVRLRRKEELRQHYLQGDSDTLNFYMLARFGYQKNQSGAVEAFCETLGEDPNLPISLSLFGAPTKGEGRKGNRDYCKNLVAYLGDQSEDIRKKVKIFGVTSPLHACAVGDVFLGPSLYETWFLSMNEAMACGLPTIVSDTPVIKEVAGEGNCFVDPLDVASIKNGVLKMATSKLYREDIANYNLSQSREYTWKRSVERLNEVFNEIMHAGD